MNDKDRGYVQVTLMLDGTGAAWASDFGATYPVVTDNDYAIAQHYAPGGSIGIPMYAVLDRRLRVQALYVNGDVSSLVSQLLAEPAPDVEWLLP